MDCRIIISYTARRPLKKVSRACCERGAPIRLICLSLQDVDADACVAWAQCVPAQVTVELIEVHRSDFFEGSGQRDLASLAQQIARRLESCVRFGGYAVFGHGVCALLAFELLHALRVRGALLPRCLLVSGVAAPGCFAFDGSVLGLPGPVWCSSLIYRQRPRTPLACPIHILCGVDDRVTGRQLRDWGDETSVGVTLRRFEGGHLYFEMQASEMVAHLSKLLAHPEGACLRSTSAY